MSPSATAAKDQKRKTISLLRETAQANAKANEDAGLQAQTELDPLLKSRDIEKIFNKTRRWIYVLIKRGKFPPPDIRGDCGASNQWKRSTVMRAYDEMFASAKVADGRRTSIANSR
jgi:predicted DNA-binding transcriptional regulator AlpA